MTSPLFSPFTLRGLTLRNRIGVSPMCQYSSEDGFANDWHLVHIGARAAGGAGLIIMEATGVSPEGRITQGCLGIWKDEHVEGLARIVKFAKSQGAAIGIQIAHAGRKAGMDVPWKGGKKLSPADGGWRAVAPSALPFAPEHGAPHALTLEEIEKVKADFVAAAKRAVAAGFDVIELHAAHGYLLNTFLSPLSNARTDIYGGTPENRRRLLNEIADGVRAAVPDRIVLGARLSCTDWMEGGVTIADSVETAKDLKSRGVDFIDCSSGGLAAEAKVAAGPLYQLPFAKDIRAQAGLPACAVGMITTAQEAEDIIARGDADLVFLARAMLRDPSFPLHAAETLGDGEAVAQLCPRPYLRGY